MFPLMATPVPEPEAPGSSCVKLAQLWPTLGNSFMTAAWKVVLCSPVSVFSRVASAVTWTCCTAAPTFNCASTVNSPTSNVMPSLTNLSKLCLEKVILYLPGRIETASYKPASFVVSSFVTPVSTLRTVMATPGITAPLASVTVPRISPELVFCARLKPARHRTKNTSSSICMDAAEILGDLDPIRIFRDSSFISVLVLPRAPHKTRHVKHLRLYEIQLDAGPTGLQDLYG